MFVETHEEALSLATAYARRGFTLLPCDDPKRGLRGICAFKDVDGTEESHVIEWPILHSELHPNEEIVDGATLYAFMKEGDVALCDEPTRLLVGFVRFVEETNEALVRQCRLAELKKLPKEQLDEVMTLRKTLLDSQQRARIECAAAMGAGQAQASG